MSATEEQKRQVLAEVSETVTAVEALLAANGACKNKTGPVLLSRSVVDVLVNAAKGFHEIIGKIP